MKCHCETAINLKSEGERNNQSVPACLREAASAKAGNPAENWRRNYEMRSPALTGFRVKFYSAFRSQDCKCPE